jgi:hypothetical protein
MLTAAADIFPGVTVAKSQPRFVVDDAVAINFSSFWDVEN